MNRCKFIHPVHAEVRFGIDLKDIYPSWYLHPNIKNLIYMAETNIRDRHGTRFNIDQLVGENIEVECAIKQGLLIKERMIHGHNILDVDVAPGIPLWVIRHFLGLLPTPIFPPKSDEHYWYNFSIRYFDPFIQCIKKRSATDDVKHVVAFELSHLPGRNLTFLFELFEMMRFLSMKSSNDDVIDKHAALVLVRFFTPSMFIRPYRPGYLAKNDKKYFAFILFTIHFWPELRTRIHDILTSSMNKNPDKFYYYPELYDNKYSENNIFLKDVGMQTENKDSISELFLQLETNSEGSAYSNLNNPESLEAKSKYIYEKLETLKNATAAQTSQNELKSLDTVEVGKMIASTPNSRTSRASRGSRASRVSRDREQLIQNISSETLEDYYKSIRKKFISNSSTQTDDHRPLYERVCNQNLDILPKFSVKISSRIKKRKPKKKTQTHDILILHIPQNTRINHLKNAKIVTYKKSQLNTNKKMKRNLKKTEASGDLNTTNINKPKEEPGVESTPNCSAVTYGWNIDSRIDKGDFIYDSFVGNCYSESPLRPKQLFSTYDLNVTPQVTPTVDLYKKITQFGWTYNRPKSSTSVIDQIDPYKLCYENDQKSLDSLTSETPLTEKVKKKKYSFMRISSKFSFFKKLGSTESKKSVSCNDLHCNVKYEKITKSANSI